MPGPQTLAGRIRTYVPWGLGTGCLLCLFLIPSLLRSGNHPLPGYGITPLQIAVVYVLSGLVGGVLVAALFPLSQWFLGAFLLGMMVAFPPYMAVAVLMRGNDSWAETWIFGGVAAFFVGGGVATQLSSESYARSRLRSSWPSFG